MLANIEHLIRITLNMYETHLFIDCQNTKNRLNYFKIYKRSSSIRCQYYKQYTYIYQAYYPNDQYHQITNTTGHIPPEVYITLDIDRYIQNENNTPIIFHITRRPNKKTVKFIANINEPTIFIFSSAIGPAVK